MKIIVRVFIALLVLFGLLFFASGPPLAGGNPGQGKSLAEARKVLEQQLISVPGFAGIAHLEGKGEIVVFLENEQAKGIVSDQFEGFPVRREVTGRFQALPTAVAEPIVPGQVNQISPDRTGVVRPLIGGISVSALAGEQYIYAGTLGMVTYDNKILSNAHVIAMDPDDSAFLELGTAIIQPGTLDGGTSANQVGALESYIPIVFYNNSNRPNPTYNYADAAIAALDPEVEGLSGWQFGETGNYQVSGTTTVAEEDTVRKSGRTTGVTEGTVYSTNAAGWVQYDTNMWAYFYDQIAIPQPFEASGDSGSVVDKDGSFVGLVFAGNDEISIVCKASYIIDGLGISVAPPGYTFTAPPAIGLGGMAPGATATGSSTGSLAGDNSDGYTVTGIDANTSNTGYMASGSYVLANKLSMGPAADNLDPADASQTFLDVSTAGTYDVPFYVSQSVAYTDAIATGYTITITFTVTEK
ncbi:MAG: hypothetical protein E3I25_02635 [Dehalococcoidia bacterium]|nr:MAG: hypothetical protein E3I25_02635 [Dehalococcoidia bacterium]